MSKRYMNRIFWETFDQNFRPPEGKYVPKEYWQWDEQTLSTSLIPKDRESARPFFSEEDLYQLRLISERKGLHNTVDETGQLLTKEQELINKKVKTIMIKAGLIPDDQRRAEEALEDRVGKIHTKSPYNSDRQRVRIYERPQITKTRIARFRKQLTLDSTIVGGEFAQMKEMLEGDALIHRDMDQDSNADQDGSQRGS